MTDGPVLTVAEARQRLLEGVTPVREIERVPLVDALGRILGEDITCRFDMPPQDIAAMDGYAVRSADLASGEDRATLRIAGVARAGHPYAASLEAGEAVEITTGAVLPIGADAVVVQESTEVKGGRVVVPGNVPAGSNRRRRGEDIAAGDTALRSGCRLRPNELGILASLGFGMVPVLRRLKVAVFSTGDELREPGTALSDGQIHDSNRLLITGTLKLLGAEVNDLGVIPDSVEAIERAVGLSAGTSDAVISSGGVSVGAADHTASVIARLGVVDFWRVAMRPGRPLAYGRIGDASFFGLPGNPVAAIVALKVLVRDALLRMMGAIEAESPPLSARCTRAIAKRPGRSEYPRGRLSVASDGTVEVTPIENQAAGALVPTREAHCLIALPHERGPVGAGERVDCLLLDGTG